MLALSGLAAILGCAKARPLVDQAPPCPTWQAGDLSNDSAPLIAQVFATNCVSCHSGPAPAANYDLTTYLGALGLPLPLSPDPQFPALTVIAVSQGQILVRALAPATADSIHAPFSDLEPVVSQWVNQCGAAFFESAFHASGILNPADPNFHGQLLQANAWNFGLCASCHGADFTGGTANASCTSCHTSPGGPTSCNTCHGMPPNEGSHFTHNDGGVGTVDQHYGCTECHVVPASYTDPGMLFDADGGVITGPPSVIFGALASSTLPGFPRQGPPIFDPTTQTCSNVYCHGDTFGDTKATNTKPHWNLPGMGQATCGTCHGLPPSDHGSDFTECSACHGLVVDANRNFIDPALHIDGALSLGNGNGTCSACHGDSTSPAPPVDLEGDTSTAATGVGAHRSHLFATNRLRGPVACGDCHLVPALINSPGHIDHNLPAWVFPSAIASSSLAFADDAGPVENVAMGQAPATCSNVYCHGGGQQMQTDRTPHLLRQPVWTEVNAGQAACGTCHGIPPLDSFHTPGVGLETCTTCHAGTIDAFGNIIVTPLPDGGATSLHIDGFIEVDGGIWGGN